MDSSESIYDGQADRAICEFCYLATRSRDPASERLKPIQSPRAEPDLRAAFSERDRSHLAYPAARSRMERAGTPRRRSCNPRGEGERVGDERINAFGARAGDNDDLVFDSRHEVLPSGSRDYRGWSLPSKNIVMNSAARHR
jgi:hypothetical protein